MKKIIIGVICLLFVISAISQSRSKWERTKRINSIEGYEKFLKNYPNGEYSDGAKIRLEGLKEDVEKELNRLKELEIKKQELATREQHNRLLRPDNFKKLQTGMTPKEVVSLLLFEDYINTTRFGGFFIGIGLLPEEGKSDNSYTGTVVLSGYYFAFENGKSTEWHIIENEIDSERFYGEYKYSALGLMTLTSNWELKGKTFHVKVKRPDGLVTNENSITEP